MLPHSWAALCHSHCPKSLEKDRYLLPFPALLDHGAAEGYLLKVSPLEYKLWTENAGGGWWVMNEELCAGRISLLLSSFWAAFLPALGLCIPLKPGELGSALGRNLPFIREDIEEIFCHQHNICWFHPALEISAEWVTRSVVQKANNYFSRNYLD